MQRLTAAMWPRACAVVVLGLLALSGCGSGDGPSAAAPGEGQASGGGGGRPQGPPPSLVRVAPVRQVNLNQRWDVVGRLVELQRSAITAEVDGKILAMPVEEGEAVVGGQTVLAQVDPVWTQLEAQRAQAAVAAAQAQLDQARRDSTYLEELSAAGSAKPKEVADARTRVQAAEAELSATEAQLSMRQRQLERLQVVAPFDGFLVKKLVEVGQWVTRGTPVAEVISRGEIDAVVDVPEQLVNQVELGRPVELLVEPLKLELEGRVTAINPSGVTAARTFPVKIRLPDQQGLLKPGMSVVARVPVSEMRQVLAVPRDAVRRTDLGAQVWADLKGVAMPVSVRVLFGHNDLYAIEPLPGAVPLAPGMLVVIEGAERLFPTAPLAVANRQEAEGPAQPAGAATTASETQPSAANS